MNLIASDSKSSVAAMLEGFDCPAILVSVGYEILATNQLYEQAFGQIDLAKSHRCFEVSHGFKVPCDEAGEDCPLGAAKKSGHRERVLHIHQTPRGKEHVDVEMLPIHDSGGKLIYFVELLRPVPLASGVISNQELVGESAAFTTMLGKVARVGGTDASVLLLGESGTGKELVARALHMASKRKDKPLVTLECSGLTESLFESELFGHIKGAFTGAQYNKKGLADLANGGTLFLDELGDIPLSIQVKLLRLIESGTFRPVGSADVHTSDFRLICATNKNLFQLVQSGQFRDDLYYRINVFPIRIPALSERTSDIPLIAKSILSRLGKNQKYHLTKPAIQLLKDYAYRGNIRELRNILNRAVVLADTSAIDEQVIKHCFEEDSVDAEPAAVNDFTADGWVDLKTNENRYIARVIAAHGGDKEQSAKILGVSLRSLYRKIE